MSGNRLTDAEKRDRAIAWFFIGALLVVVATMFSFPILKEAVLCLLPLEGIVIFGVWASLAESSNSH